MNNLLYIYQYDVAAIILDVVMLLIFFVRNRHASNSNRIFRLIVFSNLLASVFDLISCFTISNPQDYPLLLNYVVSLGYLFFYNCLAVLFLLYVSVRGKIEKQQRLVGFACLGLVAFYGLAIFTSPWTHLVAYFDENMVYGHGFLFYVLYTIPFILFIWEAYIFIHARINFTQYQVMSSVLLIVGMCVSIIITIIMPRVLIGQFLMAIITVFIYITYENPAFYCYKESQCGNRYALEEVLRKLHYQRKSISAVAFRLEEYSVLRSYYEESEVSKLLVKIADIFNQNFTDKAFFINDDTIIVLCKDTSAIITRINQLFLAPVVTSTMRQMVSFSHIIINVDVKNVADIELVLYNLKSDINNNNFDDVLKAIKDKTIYDQQLGRAVKRAISLSAFEVHYQPIYNLKTKRFESAEALIRLDDWDLGMVNPEEMIVYAERNGLINDVGSIIFKMVCRFIATNKLDELGIHYVEINMSPIQCLNPELCSEFKDIMKEYGVRPDQINLELTETAQSGDDPVFFSNIDSLNKMGISFSIDDYGSGFASANYLNKFPIDIVKIDKLILWNAMNNSSAMIVFKSTVDMLKKLGKEIVVEGGETKDMIDLLTDEGCDFCQGFYFSKPLPEDKFLEFIKKNAGSN